MRCFVTLCPSMLLLCVILLPDILALLRNQITRAVFDIVVCVFLFIIMVVGFQITFLWTSLTESAQVFNSFELLLLTVWPGCRFWSICYLVFTSSAALLFLVSDIGMLIAPRYLSSFLSAHALINNSVSTSLISLLERYYCFKDNKNRNSFLPLWFSLLIFLFSLTMFMSFLLLLSRKYSGALL